MTDLTITPPELNKGERCVGSIIVADGGTRHHLILLPTEIKGFSWGEAMEWAKDRGGDLPHRFEQSLLYAFMPEEFNKDWYWSNAQHASNSGYAWYQHFDDGYQDYGYENVKLRARAVRRVPIQ